MNSIPFLSGPRLILRDLTTADAEGPYPSWLNDPVVCRGNSHGTFPYSREAARAYIAQAQNRRDALILAIELKDGQRHIGNIALQSIHPIYRSADFAILLGEADCQGQGYGKEAGLLLCRHGFNELNLHRIACGTFSSNTAMQKLALALGMREEGRRREAAYTGGQYLDIVEYGMTHRDFLAIFPEIITHERRADDAA